MIEDDSKDLTERVLLYRETVRHIWNTALVAEADWNTRDDFNEACILLFRLLVLRHAGAVEGERAAAAAINREPLMCLRVVPTVDHGTPILINRTSPSSAYWDDPQQTVKPQDVDLRFVRFFDWDELGRRDFAYIEVVINGFRDHDNIVGRSALIECAHVRVLFEPIG